MGKSGLCPEAEVYLKNLYKLLKEQDVLTSMDDNAMSLIGSTYHNFITASKILQQEGLITKSKSGELKAHPAVKIQLDSQIQLDKLMDKFGLNPKSRKEINKPKEKEGKLSAMDIYLSNAKK